MADTPLSKKLFIKPGQRLAILNAPEGFKALLARLPDGVETKDKLDGQFDLVLSFMSSKADVDRLAPATIKSVKPGGMLWIAYPKKSSKIKSDITRDTGWETVRNAGWEGVTLISIDGVWSAMRFRPAHEVGR